MICLRWQSKSEAGIEMRRKAGAPEACKQLPGSIQDTKIFIFLFEDKMLQPQKPWQPCSEASPALRNVPPSLHPEHHLQVQHLSLVHGPCLSFPIPLLMTGVSWQLSPAPDLPFPEPPLPIWHPNWSQTLVTWHIINPRAPTGNQSQLWECLGPEPVSPFPWRGKSQRWIHWHILEGKSSKEEGKSITFFHSWEVLLPCLGNTCHPFCGITYFLDSELVSSRWWGGMSMCPLLPLHSYEIQCGFLRLIFFLPKKSVSFVFFLICPRFSHQSPTLNKQTSEMSSVG